MELPSRKPNRLSGYDYSSPNAYFITVCTDKRKNLFWQNVGAVTDRQDNVPLTTIGMAVRKHIEDIPKHYPIVSVDNYVIMPNHIDYL